MLAMERHRIGTAVPACAPCKCTARRRPTPAPTVLPCRPASPACRWVDGSNQGDLIQGFDQEAAAVLMGRVVRLLMLPALLG